MVKLAYANIPVELLNRDQWAVSTMALKEDGKPDKAPRNPATGQLVSSTDSSTWASFSDAASSGYPAIGFMLSEHDPFTIIDLDQTDNPKYCKRQAQIFATFDGYAERSISGYGCHIVLTGLVGGGCRRDKVEVYDRERYMIFTGDVVRRSPIMSNPIMLGKLVGEMGGALSGGGLPDSEPATMGDDMLLQKIGDAYNGATFRELFNGPVPEGSDWSHRDSSLAQFLAFWSRDHDQVLRLFRRSAQYRPEGKGGYNTVERYENDYLLKRTFGHAWRMLARDERAQAADIEHGATIAANFLSSTTSEDNVVEQIIPAVNGFYAITDEIAMPAGMLGEIAQYIYQSAHRPVWPIAIGGAIAFLAGLVGRQFNISQTGLNQYVVIIAKTGRGKESASAGIDRLFNACKHTAPVMAAFRGPGHIASGQALIRTMDDQPSMVSTLSEFGHTLRIITNPRASISDLRTRQVLLDLFAKSGAGRTLQSSAYADREKNTKVVEAPNFCFLGDTTPEVFFSAFDSDLVNEGFMPRFLTIDYDGERVPTNPYGGMEPPGELITRIGELLTSIMQMQYSNTYVNIGMADDATTRFAEYDKFCDRKINFDRNNSAELWNRAHLKALRLAGLIAVGCNHYEPVVMLDHVEWGISLVNRDIHKLLKRIDAGEVGEGEVRHESALIRAIKDYLGMSYEQKRKYKIPDLAIEARVVTFSYIRRRLRGIGDFQKDRRGVKRAVEEAISDACAAEIIVELTRDQMTTLGISRGRGFTLGDAFP